MEVHTKFGDNEIDDKTKTFFSTNFPISSDLPSTKFSKPRKEFKIQYYY